MKDVVSLQIAQRLQKAGWKGETEYIWECRFGKWSLIKKPDVTEHSYDTADHRPWVSAPTTAQLAEELRILCFGKLLTIEFHTNTIRAGFMPQDKIIKDFVSADTLPNCLGLMLEYLYLNNLIK